MRTNSFINVFSSVAVVAEDLQHWRPTAILEVGPKVVIGRAVRRFMVCFGHHGPSVRRAVLVDMIERQKHRLCFSTASTTSVSILLVQFFLVSLGPLYVLLC